MTRIGIDARLVGYRSGGIPNYITHLITHLAPLADEEEFFILQNWRDRHELTGADQQRINTLTPPHHRLERFSLSAELLPHRLNLLHSTDFIQPYGGYRRSIISIHDLAFMKSFGYQAEGSKDYYLRHINDAVRKANHIITISDASRDDIQEVFKVSEDRVSTTYLGIGEEFRISEPEVVTRTREKYGIPDEYLLFVGTIEPRKNIARLLDAYAQLIDQRREIPPLVFVGHRGWDSESIYQKMTALNLENETIWLEDVTHRDLPAIYTGAELLVLPSHYEGFGFPPLEAMACGTPCIVSNVSSLPEVVGDAGIYIMPHSVESIASGIEHLLDDRKLRESLIVKGREWVQRFTWEKTAAETLAIYRKVLESRS